MRGIFRLEGESIVVPGITQGMKPTSYLGNDLVVSCENEVDAYLLNSYKGLFMHVPMLDEDWFRIREKDVMVAAEAVAEMYRRGGRTLVHCTGGLNRSSVVTAMALVTLGLSRAEAVRLIREKRDPMCLCNKTFERWVLQEPLPTAETSTFNEPSVSDGEGKDNGTGVDSAG